MLNYQGVHELCGNPAGFSLSLHGHHQVLPWVAGEGGSLLKGLSAEYPRIKSDPSMIWLDVPISRPFQSSPSKNMVYHHEIPVFYMILSH